METNKKLPDDPGSINSCTDDSNNKSNCKDQPVIKPYRKFKTIEELLQNAKEHGMHKYWHSYNYYSSELSKFALTTSEYTAVTRKLAEVLEV